jgi:hypothetical protein
MQLLEGKLSQSNWAGFEDLVNIRPEDVRLVFGRPTPNERS